MLRMRAGQMRHADYRQQPKDRDLTSEMLASTEARIAFGQTQCGRHTRHSRWLNAFPFVSSVNANGLNSVLKTISNVVS